MSQNQIAIKLMTQVVKRVKPLKTFQAASFTNQCRNKKISTKIMINLSFEQVTH